MNRSFKNLITILCTVSCALVFISASRRKTPRWDEGATWDEENTTHRQKKSPRMQSRNKSDAQPQVEKSLQQPRPSTVEEYKLMKTINVLERTLKKFTDKIESVRNRFERNKISYYVFLYVTQPYYEKKAEIKSQIMKKKAKLRQIQRTTRNISKEMGKVIK